MRRLFFAAQVLAAFAMGCDSTPIQSTDESRKESASTEVSKSGKASSSKRPPKPSGVVRAPNPGAESKPDR
jgi:hypothetical protein